MPITQDVKKIIHYDHDYQQFRGKVTPSRHISNSTYHQQCIAIIGNDQNIAAQLMYIAKQAKKVIVFQQQPFPILPKSSKAMDMLVQHPLIRKNKRLFNNRIKSVLALRFLEKQVKNVWLQRQLTANFVEKKAQYLKSDDFYTALQLPQCELITWPIFHVGQHHIYTINGSILPFDTIIYAEPTAV